jgi:hypothetical protein
MASKLGTSTLGALDRRALLTAGATLLPTATSAAPAPAADDAAWREHLSVIEAAREKALRSRWGQSPQNRAQAMYFISMLQAFGFNTYMGPRQAYPTFFSDLFFTPVEYNWGAPCPDFRYHWTAIDGARTYRIWGTRGNTKWLDIQAQRGWWGDADQSHLGNWDVDDFKLGPGGSFAIIASATPQPGNWIKLDPEAHNICLLVRDVWDDWDRDLGAEIHIELLDPRPDDTVFLSQAEIDGRLGKIAAQTRYSVDFYLDLTDKIFAGAGGFNAFWRPPMPMANVGGNPRAVYIQALYDLLPDEALIVETDIPNARYWSLQLADNFFQTTDYRFHQTSLNNNQVRRDADGKARIVVSEVDPGVPNWIHTAGLRQGLAQWRWYLTDRVIVPSARKVALGDVRAQLPPDTPSVPRAQRQADLARRRAQVGRRFNV